MKKENPTLVTGTRDFGPQEIIKRNHITGIMQAVFECYSFSPLQTPAMEKLSTLTGKYGNEGDRLLFKILNSGDFLSHASSEAFEGGHKQLLPLISQKGLRYDLTVPFARYVATHQHQLVFPFRRYQIQPVWRADRPQKGRYREFFQCDADIIGTTSLISEAELITLIYQVLTRLAIPGFCIQLNHRGLLKAMAEVMGAPEKETELSIIIDKLDKIGEEKVFQKLRSSAFSEQACLKLKEIFAIFGTHKEVLHQLAHLLADSSATQPALDEIQSLLSYAKSLDENSLSVVRINPALARGLSYYTGAIFETTVDQVPIGSIAAGGLFLGFLICLG